MPIPPFDPIVNALPPFLGSPVSLVNCSPYPCSFRELCETFSTSHARVKILKGFLELRKELNAAGVTGFHWIDGSFLENIEVLDNRDPNDIDVVTFAQTLGGGTLAQFAAASPDLVNRPVIKFKYSVDHFLVPLAWTPQDQLVEVARFWYGLFSHRRTSQEWKGMLRVEFADVADDPSILKFLGTKP